MTDTCTATRHDSLDAYMHFKCRCPKARAEHTRRMKNYRLRRMAGEQPWVDPTGTRRRLQALLANGWTLNLLGARLGISGSAVSQYASPARLFVEADTARAVDDLYDRLADRRGPSTYNMTRLQRRGWLVPLWWDEDTIDDPSYQPPVVEVPRPRDDVDAVIVDRLVDGDPFPGRPTLAEKVEAYRRLVQLDTFYADIQQRLGVNSIYMRELARLADAGQHRSRSVTYPIDYAHNAAARVNRLIKAERLAEELEYLGHLPNEAERTLIRRRLQMGKVSDETWAMAVEIYIERHPEPRL